jgi:hypothetical protein
LEKYSSRLGPLVSTPTPVPITDHVGCLLTAPAQQLLLPPFCQRPPVSPLPHVGWGLSRCVGTAGEDHSHFSSSPSLTPGHALLCSDLHYPLPCFPVASPDCHSSLPSEPGIHIASSSASTRARLQLEPPANDTELHHSTASFFLYEILPATVFIHSPPAL